MKRFLYRLAAFTLTVLMTAVLASIISSQFVVAALQAIDVPFDLGTRITMTLKDLKSVQTLAAVFSACLLPAFLLAGLLAARLRQSRLAWFSAAGFSAVVALLVIIENVLGLMPVAGARSTAGLLMLGLAGAAGGALFSQLTRPLTVQSA